MRRPLLIAATVAVVILTILVVLPKFIDINNYRGQIAETLEKTLHRKVKLGEIRLSLMGGPRVRLANVEIADRARSGGAPAVTIEGIDVSLKLLPLLSRRIEVSKLTLRRPTVLLTISKDGRTNFSDLIRPPSPGKLKALPPPGETTPPPKAPPPPSASTLPSGLSISRLNIQDGTITIIDRHTVPGKTLTHRLEDLEVRLRDVSLERPIDFDVAATLVRKTRQPFRLKGTVGPIGTNPQPGKIPISMAVKTKGLEIAPLHPYLGDSIPVTNLAGSLTSDFTFTQENSGRLAVDGSAHFEGLDFTAPAYDYRPPKPLTLSVDQSIQVDFKADTIRVERFRVTIGNSTIAASGAVAKASTEPEIDIKVTSDGASLEDLAKLDPSLPDRLPPGMTLSGPLAIEVNVRGTLSDFTARGFVDAKRTRLAWKGLLDKEAGVASALRFDGRYDGRRLTLRKIHLDLHTLKLDASGSVTNLTQPIVDLKLATNTVSLAGWERVLPALKGNPLHGQFSFTGEVSGSKADPANSRVSGRLVLSKVGPVEKIFTLAPPLKSYWPKDLALAGTATADVTIQGTMQSFDITGKVDLKEGDFRYGELLKKPRGERANLTFSGRYRGGDVTIEQFSLAIKDLEVSGRGSVKNLKDPVVDLALRTSRVDLARWVPAGKKLTGQVSLAVGVKGRVSKPETLVFTQSDITVSGIGPLETVLETLPALRAALPPGFKMSGKADASVSFSGSFPKLSGRAVVDLTKVGLHHPDWIIKPSGQPARVVVEGRYTGKSFTLKTFEAILGKDWIRGAAHVADLDQPRGSLTVASSPVKLERLAESLPFLKRYGLAGTVSVDIHVQGDTARLKDVQAKGIVEVRDLKARLPQLAAPLEKMTGTIELKGQEVILKKFTLAYGDSILSLSATVRGFDAPQVSFNLDAPRLVLHQWKAAEKKERASIDPPRAEENFGPPARILLVKAPERPDDWLSWFKKVSASGDVRVRQVVYNDLLLENLQAKTSLRQGVFILNRLTFGLHGGRYDGSAVVDLDPASARFSFRSSLVGVDVNKLLTANAKLPNTIWGRLQATLDIRGRGHTAAALLPTLSGRGQATVTDGQINMAIVRDLLNNMPIFKLAGIIPGFQKLNTCKAQFTRQETTPFRTLTMPITINRGIAAVAPSTLMLDSQDIDVVTGANPGVIDLPRQEINFRDIWAVFSPELTDQCLGADAKPVLTDSAGRMTFPFACRGSFRGGHRPKCRPDERYLLNAGLRLASQKLFKGKGGGIGGLLGEVLGGGSPLPPPVQPGSQQPTQPSQPGSQTLPLPGGLEDLLKIIQ